MSEYAAQLLAVDAKLAKDPENEELLSLKADLMELIELSTGLEDEEKEAELNKESAKRRDDEQRAVSKNASSTASSSKSGLDYQPTNESSSQVDKNNRRTISEVELLAKKKEKNRKKKAKLRERVREQLDIAESEKQSWQSFANKKGLKGVTKKSIFASPCSVTGKVGVGTNGIADAPSVAARGAPVAATLIKRKH